MPAPDPCTVFRLLRARYGIIPDTTRHFLDFDNPFQVLVMTILSAQTTDRTVNAVKPALFARYPDAASLAAADPDEVASVIRSTGFYRVKARHIVAAARILCERYGCQVPATMEELLALPGIGRKTANIILHHAFGITAGIAVDTHVKRVSTRLGLSDAPAPDAIEQDLLEAFPKAVWGEINYLFIRLGREICDARRPRCGICPLAGHCRYYREKKAEL
ncbi:MAG: endonuclease III [Methanomicrobiales archaeon]|nr:endonuclease III [Methanomicrobiales archaeon]